MDSQAGVNFNALQYITVVFDIQPRILAPFNGHNAFINSESDPKTECSCSTHYTRLIFMSIKLRAWVLIVCYVNI